MFACRRSAGKPSRSPRTAPARCRAVRCGPRRSSSSRRSRTGTACWRARSRPYGVRCGPETGPRHGGRRQRGSASPSGTPVAGSPPASETAVPRSSNDSWRSSAPSFSDFLPNRSLRSSSLGCSSRRTCSTISAFSASSRAASASAARRAPGSSFQRRQRSRNHRRRRRTVASRDDGGRAGHRPDMARIGVPAPANNPGVDHSAASGG